MLKVLKSINIQIIIIKKIIQIISECRLELNRLAQLVLVSTRKTNEGSRSLKHPYLSSHLHRSVFWSLITINSFLYIYSTKIVFRGMLMPTHWARQLWPILPAVLFFSHNVHSVIRVPAQKKFKNHSPIRWRRQYVWMQPVGIFLNLKLWHQKFKISYENSK